MTLFSRSAIKPQRLKEPFRWRSSFPGISCLIPRANTQLWWRVAWEEPSAFCSGLNPAFRHSRIRTGSPSPLYSAFTRRFRQDFLEDDASRGPRSLSELSPPSPWTHSSMESPRIVQGALWLGRDHTQIFRIPISNSQTASCSHAFFGRLLKPASYFPFFFKFLLKQIIIRYGNDGCPVWPFSLGLWRGLGPGRGLRAKDAPCPAGLGAAGPCGWTLSSPAALSQLLI